MCQCGLNNQLTFVKKKKKTALISPLTLSRFSRKYQHDEFYQIRSRNPHGKESTGQLICGRQNTSHTLVHVPMQKFTVFKVN